MIEKYKQYLDIGTNEGLRYNDETISRYVSFCLCLEHLQKINNPSVLELGTCRSFVDGKFIGCNEDDTKYWEPADISKWDWGGGCFSLLFGQLPNCKLTTIDLMASHINRCKIMTGSLGIKCSHIVSSSATFLSKTKETYDLIYLDTGDMWPIEPTENLQLEEAKMIVDRKLLETRWVALDR